MRKFTLIELIIVIVMLGILSTFTFGFISWGARYYLDVSERQLVLDDSRFIIERLTRELRTALPYSIRTLTDSDEYACIEYVPIVASGRYIDIPQNPADSDDITVSVISPTSGSLAAGNQFSVFTTSANEVYDSSNNQTFTIDSVSAIALDSSQTVSFSSAISSSSDSSVSGSASIKPLSNNVLNHDITFLMSELYTRSPSNSGTISEK